MAAEHLALTAPHISRSLLVSAYDLHFGLLGNAKPLLRGKELVFIDSGGYELAPEYDAAEPKCFEYRPRDAYSETDYISLLETLPKTMPCVIANFDWGHRLDSLHGQLKAAKALFGRFPHWLGSLLVRPGVDSRGTPNPYLDVRAICRNAGRFGGFGIIGFTERELGPFQMDRLTAVSAIREALDRKGLAPTPIHIWGCLDPLMSTLYFLHGASVFDGLSWLRFGFCGGLSVTMDDAIVLAGELPSGRNARAAIYGRNLAQLVSLEGEMRRFVDWGCTDFGAFTSNTDLLMNACKAILGVKARGRRNRNGRVRRAT